MSHLQQSSVPLHFPPPDVVIVTEARPHHWAFYFDGYRLLLSVSGSRSGSMCKAHIAMQEPQAVATILLRMVFQLSDMLVVMHLDNCNAKAYLCH